MKSILSFAIAAILLAAVVPAALAAGSKESGLVIQEYWFSGKPGYWIGNASSSPLTVQLTASYKDAIDTTLGPYTVAAGSAIDVDAAPIVGADKVRLYTGNNVLAGTISAPGKAPTTGSRQAIVLTSPANGAPAYRNIRLELPAQPTLADRTLKMTLIINGPLGAFVDIYAPSDRQFSPSRIVSVSTSGLPVSRNSAGDWIIDARKAGKTPLVKVSIVLVPAAATTPTMVTLDASLVDSSRVLASLSRAILIAAAASARH